MKMRNIISHIIYHIYKTYKTDLKWNTKYRNKTNVALSFVTLIKAKKINISQSLVILIADSALLSVESANVKK